MASIVEGMVTKRKNNDPILSSFLGSQSKWLDEPVLNCWKGDPSKIEALKYVSELYQQWTNVRAGPFSPHLDRLWIETAKIMRDAGLPWHTNNVNMPEEIDKSWPLHFKGFERVAILSKGVRVGCQDVTGYITTWMEANIYGIRALQQELRHRFPGHRPLLTGCQIEAEVLEAAAQLLGLEAVRLDRRKWDSACDALLRLSGGHRPIIFAASLGSSDGQTDDYSAIKRIGRAAILVLHVDASRTFDYVTTATPSDREQRGIPQLRLTHPFEKMDEEQSTTGDMIKAATIVAGGTNYVSPPNTAILKPRGLGSTADIKVEYVRGTDCTISGSRDSIGPLWTCLQELRFRPSGLRQIFSQCAANRSVLSNILMRHGVETEAPPASLDLIIRRVDIAPTICHRWGIKRITKQSSFLLTVQPSATEQDLQGLVKDIVKSEFSVCHFQNVRLPREDMARCSEHTATIKVAVDDFRTAVLNSGGYPLNMAAYSALGPILGNFLPISLPPKWIEDTKREILEGRKISLGLSPHQTRSFPGCFTTGSTEGNRVAIHTALAAYPDSFVYFSSATHYSVRKIVRDSDMLNGIWDQDNRPRFVEVGADDLGRMLPEQLVAKALEDRLYCISKTRQYRAILFCNMGTTFVGGRDNIVELRSKLTAHGIEISYIHVDGALELGFASDSVVLGPPGTPPSRGGRPVVQGITISHHKVYGVMVSGEVICYSPNGQLIPTPVAIDPRAVFETWLFQHMYSAKELLRIRQYCKSNACRLREALAKTGCVLRYNEDSLITLLERVPPWLVTEFHLAPEGGWVHYITMPHITPAAVERFSARVSEVNVNLQSMFEMLKEPLMAALGQQHVILKRIGACDEPLLFKIAAMMRSNYLGDISEGGRSISLNVVKQKYVYSALSFAAVSGHNTKEPLVVFLASADAKRNLTPGPVLIAGTGRRRGWDIELIEATGRTGFRWFAESMGLNIVGG